MKSLEKVRKRDRNRGHYFKNPSYRSKVTKILLIHLLIKITQQGLVTVSAPNVLISWAVLSFWLASYLLTSSTVLEKQGIKSV